MQTTMTRWLFSRQQNPFLSPSAFSYVILGLVFSSSKWEGNDMKHMMAGTLPQGKYPQPKLQKEICDNQYWYHFKSLQGQQNQNNSFCDFLICLQRR